MYEIREIRNKTEYNPLLVSKQTPFTQAWFYGEWQEIMGRKVRRFEVKKDSEIIGFFQIIKYPLLFKQNLLYIPHAPLLLRQPADSEGQAEFLEEFHKKLFEIGEEENAIFARFDLYFHNWNYGSKENLNKYFKRVPNYAYNSVYFQPKYEWVLNIDKPESELLGNMHPKNRYSIRLAENKGVTIEIIENNFVPLRGISRREKKYFDIFYELLNQTAKRNKFNLHPKIYYQNIFETLNSDNAFLVLAKYDDKILAMNLILFFGEIAYFVFGGSSDEYKNLMAPHLSHWQGIIEAKRRNCKIYNFGAVDSGKFSAQGGPASGWEGISIFKKRFGGQLLEYSDSYDLILKPFWYRLYNLRKWVLNQK